MAQALAQATQRATELTAASSQVSAAHAEVESLQGLLDTCRREHERDKRHWDSLLRSKDASLQDLAQQLQQATRQHAGADSPLVQSLQQQLHLALEQLRVARDECDGQRQTAISLQAELSQTRHTTTLLRDQVAQLTSEATSSRLTDQRTAERDKEHARLLQAIREECIVSSRLKTLLQDKDHALDRMQHDHAQTLELLKERARALEDLLLQRQSEVDMLDCSLGISVREKDVLLKQLREESQRMAMLVSLFTDSRVESDAVQQLPP